MVTGFNVTNLHFTEVPGGGLDFWPSLCVHPAAFAER
jgi:hypothetical protein